MEPIKTWLSDLLGEMENSENRELCRELLKKCGAGCAKRNALPGMRGLKEALSGLSDPDEIAGLIGSYTGAECLPAAGGFTLAYNRGKGCDCALVKGGYAASPVFCNCTLGFHQTVWSEIFERPVTVELIETFLWGGNCCAQKITLG